MTNMRKEDVAKMQIKRIEKEIRDTPKHKATEHYIGRLRAKLAKIKERIEEQESKKTGGGGGYAIRKQGDATVVLIGPPSAGKSTLLNRLTNAHSKVAPYSFTTVSVIPGMMRYKNTDIQILDVPGLIEGAEIGKGRGREVLSVVRGADLIIIMSDIERAQAINHIVKTLESSGIRINKKKPEVRIEKKNSGGLIIHSNIKQGFDKETIKEIACEMGVKNAEITIKESLDVEELIDAFSKNRVYVPAIFVINKIDVGNFQNHEKFLLISAEKGNGIKKLKKAIWSKLGFLRVYLVKPDAEPDFSDPIVVKSGYSLADVAKDIGSEFFENKKGAKIWGSGAKFPGQEVSLSAKAVEGMMIRFI